MKIVSRYLCGSLLISSVQHDIVLNSSLSLTPLSIHSPVAQLILNFSLWFCYRVKVQKEQTSHFSESEIEQSELSDCSAPSIFFF